MNREIYIIIDRDSHSYEAIMCIYDSFEKAMNSELWEQYKDTPDQNGYGDQLFIYKTGIK